MLLRRASSQWMRRSTAFSCRRFSSTSSNVPAVQNNDDHIERMDLWSGLPTGTGGRHSNSGQFVCIFGATGFLGQYVVGELGKHGTNMVVCTQDDDISWRHLKVAGDYGKIVPAYISLNDEDSIRRAIEGCDTVINLAGKHYETKHYAPSIINCSFEKVHVKGAEMIARVSRELDVKHLVHVSAACASKTSRSRFARTKYQGEEVVNAEFPGAVIVRPNAMYGEMDRFLNDYAYCVKVFPWIPLIQGGGEAKRSPVYVDDVGRAVATLARHYVTAGEVFNLSGPHEYTQKEIFEYVMDQTMRPKPFVEVPESLFRLVAKGVNLLPNPYVTPDAVDLMFEDFPATNTAEAWEKLGFGTDIANFEVKGYNFLHRHVVGGHYGAMRAAKDLEKHAQSVHKHSA